MLVTIVFFHFSADFELIHYPTDGQLHIKRRTFEEANDLLGLNPKKRYPEGTDTRHLTGARKELAMNTIRQRRFQRKRSLKVSW